MTSQTLIRQDGTKLAYISFWPEKPSCDVTLVYLHGLWSDKNATKALFMAEACERLHIPIIRFDAYAHGDSDGHMDDFTIGRAVADMQHIINECTHGPVILAGSSMGGWVSLKTMLHCPDRVKGILGVAAAPDFTTHDSVTVENGYSAALIADGQNQTVMDKDWSFDGPMHLIQGKLDASVPWETADKIAAKLAPGQVKITYIEDGDHRINRPEDLSLQEAALLDIINRL